jgi:hypothetical protein
VTKRRDSRWPAAGRREKTLAKRVPPEFKGHPVLDAGAQTIVAGPGHAAAVHARLRIPIGHFDRRPSRQRHSCALQSKMLVYLGVAAVTVGLIRFYDGKFVRAVSEELHNLRAQIDNLIWIALRVEVNVGLRYELGSGEF